MFYFIDGMLEHTCIYDGWDRDARGVGLWCVISRAFVVSGQEGRNEEWNGMEKSTFGNNLKFRRRVCMQLLS